MLYEQHHGRVYAYVVGRGARACVDEVVADTFVVAWRRFGQLPKHPLPWLIGVARNVLRERHRYDVRADVVRDHLLRWATISDVVTPDVADEVVERSVVLRALARLSDADREVLTLLAWHGLDPAGAAAVLGCSRATFLVRLHRARGRLERALEDVGNAASYAATGSTRAAAKTTGAAATTTAGTANADRHRNTPRQQELLI